MSIELDDILFNKSAIIRRCINRIREEYHASPDLSNYTNVDAMVLNIERACQATIDMATHIIAKKKLGIPQSSADAFLLLFNNKIIDDKLLHSLQAMSGFRNIAVHEYQTLDNSILKYIGEEGYKDFEIFCKTLGLDIK